MSGPTFVRLLAGSEHYALPVEAVREVVPIGDLSHVPGAPAHVLGVCTVRGDVVAVIDLAAITGLGAAAAPAVVAVFEQAGRRAGLAADAVTDVGRLPERCEAPPSPLLCGAAMAGGQLVGVLDPEAVLTAATWRPGG